MDQLICERHSDGRWIIRLPQQTEYPAIQVREEIAEALDEYLEDLVRGKAS